MVADFERWPEWNPDVRSAEISGPLAEGTELRWRAGPSRITSTLQWVERPRGIGWTGRTLGIKAVHVWWFEQRGERTFVRTAESWEGLLARLMRRRMSRVLQKSLDDGLPHLAVEAERRAKLQGG